jgi:hypothetical protein
MGTKVYGCQEGDWLRLSGEPGYMRINDPSDGTVLIISKVPQQPSARHGLTELGQALERDASNEAAKQAKVVAVVDMENEVVMKPLAIAKAVEKLQRERNFISSRIEVMVRYCFTVVVGCRAYLDKEYDALKTDGVKAFTLAKVNGTVKQATTTEAKVMAASAASGAVALGVGGGAVGLGAGAGVGALVGVVPAVFTFGLSIPVGAFIGGGAGLCAGTAVGSGCGLVGGGVAGRYGYSHREQIKGAFGYGVEQVGSCANGLRQRLVAQRQYVGKLVSGGRNENVL